MEVYISEYLKVINQPNKHLIKYALFSSLGKHTLLTTWKVRFEFAVPVSLLLQAGTRQHKKDWALVFLPLLPTLSSAPYHKDGDLTWTLKLHPNSVHMPCKQLPLTGPWGLGDWYWQKTGLSRSWKGTGNLRSCVFRVWCGRWLRLWAGPSLLALQTLCPKGRGPLAW